MHAVTKMAVLMKFRLTKWIFMDSIVLAHFNQILQSKISQNWWFWQILVKFIKAKSVWWIWRLWQICAIFITSCISGHTQYTKDRLPATAEWQKTKNFDLPEEQVWFYKKMLDKWRPKDKLKKKLQYLSFIIINSIFDF